MNPQFPQRSQSDVVQSVSILNNELDVMGKSITQQSVNMTNGSDASKTEVVRDRKEGTDFLCHLSEVASKRLEARKGSESSDGNPKQAFRCDPGVLSSRQEAQKRRDLAVDMFGSCLHSSTTLALIQGNNNNNTESKKQMKKRDRSYLRKGKWTPEEEEYTSRIIQHFRSGLLTLPEGATLRSYIAQKLSCDPMRITKKFAGASCLGKRVYHLHERSQFTLHDIEMAKSELNELERRFRLRVEEGVCPHVFGAQGTDSMIHGSNQGNMNNPAGLVRMSLVNQPLGLSTMDPSWLAKYAAALGASAMSAPGLSAFMLQFIATQQTLTQQQQQHQQMQQIQFQQSNQNCESSNQFSENSMNPPWQQSTKVFEQTQQQHNTLHQQQEVGHLFDSNQNNIKNVTQSQQQQRRSNNLKLLPMEVNTKAPTETNLNENNEKVLANYSQQGVGQYNPPVTQISHNLNGQEQSSSSTSGPLLVHPQGLISTVHKSNTNGIGQQQQSYSDINGVQTCSKRKRSKEDVDAGNTLLSFLQELRNNHSKALSMCESTEDKSHQDSDSDKKTLIGRNGPFHGSKIESDLQIHARNEVTDSGSSLSGGDSRSENVNKADSIKSDSSNECASNGTFSEDDQKQVAKKGLMGPIRKRFRHAEFSFDVLKANNNDSSKN